MKRVIVLRGIGTLLCAIPPFYPLQSRAVTDETSFVQACHAMGAGFYQLPQSDVCLKIDGDVRYDLIAGRDLYAGKHRKTWSHGARATLRADSRSQTELGMLRSYIEFEYNLVDGAGENAELTDVFIEFNGLRVGASDSQFGSWLGSAGNVLNDDVIGYAGGMTNQINYTMRFSDGLSAMFGAEQGAESEDSSAETARYSRKAGRDEHDYSIIDHVPHLVAGLSFERRWGTLAAVVGYDSVSREIAAKLRLDLKVSDAVSAFVMGGFQSDPEKPNYFGAWNGTYAVWNGVSAKVSPRVTINSQIAYEATGTYALALNLEYEVVPRFIVTAELDYTAFARQAGEHDDALASMIRVQCDF